VSVEGAGVVLFLSDGTHAGFGAVTDAQGSFCIAGVPAGTYDLQILVDDYATGYLRGVEVTDSSTDVDAEIGLPPAALLLPRPNPATDFVRFVIRLSTADATRLEIFDPTGRFVRGWQADELRAGLTSVNWDLRDALGRRVPAGWFLARLSVGGRTYTRPVVLVR
jgi:hypothetical protein